MTRVAHCILGYFPQLGGAENQARLLVRCLSAQGVSVTVFTRSYSENTLPEPDRKSTLIRVWRASGLASKEISAMLIALRLIIQRRYFDLFHVHQLNVLAFFVTLAGRLANKPVIIKVANSGVKFDFVTLAKRPFGKYMVAYLRRSDAHFIALSYPIAELLIESGIRPERVHIIPNGVELAPLEDPRCSGSDIGFIGRLESVKRPSIVLGLARRFPEKHFHFFGDGNLRTSLEEQVKKLTLNNVTFHGNLSATAEIYSKVGLIIHPSESEGMSNTLLEAVSCGIRCVVTDLPENRALFCDCSAIVEYVAETKLSGWEDALQRSLTVCPESVAKDSVKLSERYDIHYVADAYIDLYRGATNG